MTNCTKKDVTQLAYVGNKSWVLLTSVLKTSVKNSKIKRIAKFYVKESYLILSISWIHNFQDKIFTLDFLTHVLSALINISHK